MRFRKRHAWGAVLIALFALPVLRPQGFPIFEDPIADIVTWSAKTPVLNPNRWKAAEGPGLRSAGDAEQGDSRRVQALEHQIDHLWEEHLQLVQRVQDAKSLRQALDTGDLARLPKICVARVLVAQDAVSTRRSITIDRGSADGVAVGHPVVMGRVYLGRVRVVRSHSSIVQLVTDPHSRLGVFVRTDKGILLRGFARRDGRRDGRDAMKIEFVHLDDDAGEVRVGSPVFTANADERLPAHLLVGRVSEVSDPDLDRMPKLTLRPALDLDRATDVVVLLTRSRQAPSRESPSRKTPSRRDRSR